MGRGWVQWILGHGKRMRNSLQASEVTRSATMGLSTGSPAVGIWLSYHTFIGSPTTPLYSTPPKFPL